MKKILLALAFTFGIFTGTAKADPSCIRYDDPFGVVCAAYSMPPGATECAPGSTPGAGIVHLFTATNYGGICAALPFNSYIPDLTNSGWRNSIRSVKHGSGAHSRACNGTSFTGGCADMGGSYGSNFPNTAGPYNWGSIQTG